MRKQKNDFLIHLKWFIMHCQRQGSAGSVGCCSGLLYWPFPAFEFFRMAVCGFGRLLLRSALLFYEVALIFDGEQDGINCFRLRIVVFRLFPLQWTFPNFSPNFRRGTRWHQRFSVLDWFFTSSPWNGRFLTLTPILDGEHDGINGFRFWHGLITFGTVFSTFPQNGLLH